MTVHLVTGPSCSGKTTWCRERATADDIVIDFDALADALCPAGEAHRHSPHVRQIAAQVRMAAIRAATGARWPGDVYVILADPPEQVLHDYLRRGAQHIELDPGEAVVLERCRRERPRASYDLAERWYRAREVRA